MFCGFYNRNLKFGLKKSMIVENPENLKVKQDEYQESK